MSRTILTNALAGYKSECEATNQAIILDQFVFAYIPDLDVDADISPDETLPPDDCIVGRFPVTQKGRINPNAVVYSVILGTDIGTFDFNAIYLVNEEMNLAGAIIHLKTQTKQAADPENGIEGDTLTRNIITPYLNASALTQIVVDADTWQLDFNNRLTAIDERQRQNNLALYQDASFIKNSYQVSLNGNGSSIDVAIGTAYVGGLKCVNETVKTLDLTGVILPKTVYLVASFQGDITSKWETVTHIQLAESLDASWVKDGVTYYSAPIAKLTHSEIEDLRVLDWRTNHELENTAKLAQITAIMRQIEGKLGRVRIYMADDIDKEYLPVLGQTILKADYPDYFEYLGISDEQYTMPDWSKHPYLHQASGAIPAGATLEQQLLAHAHSARSTSMEKWTPQITIDDHAAHTHNFNGDISEHTHFTLHKSTKQQPDKVYSSDSYSSWNGVASTAIGTINGSQRFIGSDNNAADVSPTSSAGGSVSGTTESGGAYTHKTTSDTLPEFTPEITIESTGKELLRPNSTAVVFAVKVKYLVPTDLLVV